jgi:hypothetical protein
MAPFGLLASQLGWLPVMSGRRQQFAGRALFKLQSGRM